MYQRDLFIFLLLKIFGLISNFGNTFLVIFMAASTILGFHADMQNFLQFFFWFFTKIWINNLKLSEKQTN